MSRLTTLILKTFFPPFVITFFIAWFVLLMQFLWFFMEKISGKGLSFGLVMELIIYRSAALLPLAIPLAALIAGVMVIGGLAEHYELAAVHSGGKSLASVLAPLAATGVVLAGLSYLSADYLIPAANLQFLQRLGDVQRKKPDLNIEAGIFNEDLANFNVYASDRDPSTGELLGVRLYDQRGYGKYAPINQITASRGTFSTGSTGNSLVLTLYNGEHLKENTADVRGGEFTRTSFRSHQLSFDLSQFDFQEATNLAGSDHYALLPTWELKMAADSILMNMQRKRREFASATSRLLSQTVRPRNETTPPNNTAPPVLSSQTVSPSPIPIISQFTPAQDPTEDFALLPVQRRKDHIQPLRNKIRQFQQQARTALSYEEQERGRYEHYRFERHGKFGLAGACLFFVLIGGSAGAVVRKGGFGYPLLTGIGCFVSYILLFEFCRRLMKSEILSGPAAAWIPVLVLSLCSLIIFHRASSR